MSTESPGNDGIELIIIANIVTTEAGFDALHDDWLRLHDNCPTAGLFNSWYWSRLWWQHYGEMGELFIVTVSVDDVIQGIAPLYRCKTRALKLYKISTLRFIGSGGDTSPDDLGLLYAEGVENLVVDSVCETIFHTSQCTRVQLNDVMESSSLANALIASARKSEWKFLTARFQSRRVDTLPASIEAFEKRLGRNARKQRRRRRQKLLSAGTNVEFKTCVSPTDIRSLFKELIRLHHLRRALKGGSDSFQTDRYRQFHLAVMEKALQSNQLRLMQLIVDGKTIGIEYSFLCKGTLSLFQTGFDPSFQHLGPGHLLMMETIDRAIEDGASRLDLLKGDYEYKKSYARQSTISIDLDLWKNPMIAMINYFVSSIKSQGFNKIDRGISLKATSVLAENSPKQLTESAAVQAPEKRR